MGTVEKIVESLMKISDDKKSQLTARYTEHSSWMNSELALIRELIKQSPRDDHKSNDENVSPPSAETRSSSERSDEESAIRNKRKSPDMVISGFSPDLKRTSTQDYEELATSAGLPTDLNRLNKDHLLEELESRGNTYFSKKSLKKDLVDALKDCLLKSSKDTEPVNAEAKVAAVQDFRAFLPELQVEEEECAPTGAMDLVFSPVKALVNDHVQPLTSPSGNTTTVWMEVASPGPGPPNSLSPATSGKWPFIF
jgi:hypothetical protein